MNIRNPEETSSVYTGRVDDYSSRANRQRLEDQLELQRLAELRHYRSTFRYICALSRYELLNVSFGGSCL